MNRPKICLTLTGKTLEEDLAIANKYKQYVDLVELRADYLSQEERLRIREFPSMTDLPCILTIRRKIDGGAYVEGEAARTVLFARALSFSNAENKTFAYIDFEEDFRVPSLEDAAVAFGTKIIRSVHSMDKPIDNLIQRMETLCTSGYEIPKIAFMPKTLKDVQTLFEQASTLKDNNHILIAMGPMGVPSRILSYKLKNYLTFVSAPETAANTANLAHIDPITINNMYHFTSIDENTKIYGITGWPLKATSSPALHNQGYADKKMNAVYVPFCAETFDDAFDFANSIGVEGFSVTVPHKEKVLQKADFLDANVMNIGASNTLVKNKDKWYAYNTDVTGFSRSLLEFTGLKNLKFKKVAIIGAGGAAKAIAEAVKKLGGDACVFNRTVSKAKELAEKYNFKYAGLSSDYKKLLAKYSQIIIQTTTKGMGAQGPYSAENDPIAFYEFTGKEMVFDIVYVPEVTPIMQRAAASGCKTINGFDMLKYQGWEQFELFTGESIN